ncbi:ribonuclease M5 [Entomoplasma freundtii]|uniref:Ribonuclease M5 n=1 Tax=Entomoplasma freundtii TaxID=74700 RepID=A0A2K8NQB3_9MOLU|nr:ribonuclease M5 [Entomoplasma freundtii]ATZ16030.1 ribonuclease M5 [Entomoplasma freundtii]TDY58101.1 ribonuclease M5 [Entomoplasma freundtii]
MIKTIHEVFVVEGKTDTQKLQKILGPNVKTLETHGLRLDQEFFAFLNQLNHQCGLIIFTDPDTAGQKIRQRLLNVLDGPVKQAFLPKTAFNSKKKKKGVAEADDEAILTVLNQLMTFDACQSDCLTWTEYLKLNLNDKKQRDLLAQKLHWPTTLTSKTFYKWLNWSGQTQEKIRILLED